MSRTLYTARFYADAPSSSTSTDSSKQLPPHRPMTAYLDSLAKTHLALNQLEEVPDSRPNSPDPEAREELRTRVAKALHDAKGNPSSGKWGVVTRLLQTASSRYRYINTRTDVAPPEPGPDGWPLLETEEEWFAWERKRKEEKAALEEQRQEEMALEAQRKEELDVEIQRKQQEERRAETAKRTAIESWQRSVTSDPEVPPEEIPPPSFPSQLETSTPPPLNHRKGNSFGKELVPSSSPLSSPSKPRKQVPLSTLSALQEIPSSSPLSSPPTRESAFKRPRSASPTPIVNKKPRPAPRITPPNSTLPKLQDLIAASAQKKREKGKGKAKEKPFPVLRRKTSSPLPALKRKSSSPLAAASSPVQNDDEDGGKRFDGIEDVINWDHALEGKLSEHVMVSPSKSLSSIDGSNSLESQDGMAMPNFSDGAIFDPQGASTQPMGRLESGGSSLDTMDRGGFGQPVDFGFPQTYESQTDVESNMLGVEQLLDHDVGGPWMGMGAEPDEDEERWRGGEIESSP
ncbi:hypothetical protein FB45DRAFT_779487 [Roridomyces roridus]|uniref:Uncharacterized protein n=1 Tax=Roridomyces roridus TaxID=1738132 RepID=A0AAD7CLV6_9AGAR|nr:hypothetical protein FB45DRAFT_779487 [Roridomyces roridus]